VDGGVLEFDGEAEEAENADVVILALMLAAKKFAVSGEMESLLGCGRYQ
jgi:hypothetical protein